MLGVPKYWREGGGDAVKGDQLQLLHNIIKKTDIVSPWTVGRYSDLNGATIYSKVYVKGDLDWCK